MRKCDLVAHLTDQANTELLPGSMTLHHAGEEGYNNLWMKTVAQLRYLNLHKDKADWLVATHACW